MNRLVLYTDPQGNEYVVLCTDQEYYDGIKEDATVVANIDVDGDLTPWPTNRPLTADF